MEQLVNMGVCMVISRFFFYRSKKFPYTNLDIHRIHTCVHIAYIQA